MNCLMSETSEGMLAALGGRVVGISMSLEVRKQAGQPNCGGQPQLSSERTDFVELG